MSIITPCLWFDTDGEDAARFYTTVFPNSRINDITHYGDAGPRPAGTVMTDQLELDGQRFLALNGGPEFTFSEAISFQVGCTTQDEVDRYWSTLSDGGAEGPCGWLKDRYGMSWQIVPTALVELFSDPDRGNVADGHARDAADDEDRHRRTRARRGGRRPARQPREPIIALTRVSRDEKRVLDGRCSVQGPGLAPPDERVTAERGETDETVRLPSLCLEPPRTSADAVNARPGWPRAINRATVAPGDPGPSPAGPLWSAQPPRISYARRPRRRRAHPALRLQRQPELDSVGVGEVADRDADERETAGRDQRRRCGKQCSGGGQNDGGLRSGPRQGVRSCDAREVVEAEPKHDGAADPAPVTQTTRDAVDEPHEDGVDLPGRPVRTAKGAL